MALLRWQWTVANGGKVSADIDTAASTETVSQGSRVLSQCSRGEKPDGHVVVVTSERAPGSDERPPIEAILTFDPRTPICILRVDGHEVAPSTWPVRQRPAPPKPKRAYGTYVLLALLMGALLCAGAWMLSLPSSGRASAERKLDGTHRAMNGLLIAHFDGDLDPKPAVMPPGVGGVVLEDKSKTATIVIAAQTLGPSATRDPWVLQQTLRDEALANVPKGTARYEEVARRDETCLGERGAVVIGHMTQASAQRARVWSCTFVHEGAGYIALYMLAEPASASDERRVRGIIDATELTRLADLGTAADPAFPTSAVTR